LGSEWRYVRLGDVIEVRHGWAFKSKLFSDQLSDRPIVVNIGNFRYTGGFRFESTTVREYRGEYPLEYELSPNEILLVMTCQTAGGEILGIPARVPDDGKTYLHNQRLGRVVVRDSSLIDEGFLYWLFLSPSFNRELYLSASGTKILHTAPKRIEAVRVPLPSLNEQRAIAHILGTLDDKIELNRRMSETLEFIARALFQSWFVDFDPVRAKSEGRDPGLPKSIAELFPDSFKHSELGQIPRGWSVGILGDVAEHRRRSVKPDQIDVHTPYIALEHMPKRCIALTEWGVADGLKSGKFQFERGEILFGKLRPYFHKVGVAPVNGICSTDIVVVRPRTEEWLGLVLGHISSAAFVEYTNAGSTGTKMPRTSWQEMARYAVVLPPIEVAQAFTALLQPVAARILASVRGSRALAEARHALLPKIISGELRVSSEGTRPTTLIDQ
jgi:type I restriction enzyme, S subunit